MESQQAVPKFMPHEGMHPDDCDTVADWIVEKFHAWVDKRGLEGITIEPYFTEHRTIRAKVFDESIMLSRRCWFDGRRWRLA